MSSTCIDLLIDVMEKCHIPKEVLLDAIDQVHFYSATSSPIQSAPLPKLAKHSRSTSRANSIVKSVTKVSISTTARKTSTTCEVSSKRSSNAFLNRLSVYERAREEKRAKQKQLLEETQRLVCCFKPQINSNRLTQSRQQVYNKLYDLHKKHKEKNIRLKKEKDEQERDKEIMECTFKPSINSSNKGRSRFMYTKRMHKSSQYRTATSMESYKPQKNVHHLNTEDNTKKNKDAVKIENPVIEENILKEVTNTEELIHISKERKDNEKCIPILRRQLMSHIIEQTLLQKQSNTTSVINISLMKNYRAKSTISKTKYCNKENGI